MSPKNHITAQHIKAVLPYLQGDDIRVHIYYKVDQTRRH